MSSPTGISTLGLEEVRSFCTEKPEGLVVELALYIAFLNTPLVVVVMLLPAWMFFTNASVRVVM